MKIFRYAAYAWMIIVGGLLIVPGQPPQCIICGAPFNYLVTVISVVLAAVGIYNETQRAGAA